MHFFIDHKNIRLNWDAIFYCFSPGGCVFPYFTFYLCHTGVSLCMKLLDVALSFQICSGCWNNWVSVKCCCGFWNVRYLDDIMTCLNNMDFVVDGVVNHFSLVHIQAKARGFIWIEWKYLSRSYDESLYEKQHLVMGDLFHFIFSSFIKLKYARVKISKNSVLKHIWSSSFR